LKLEYENLPPATICNRSVGENETVGLINDVEKPLPLPNEAKPVPTSNE
jgi:hypothetical protein